MREIHVERCLNLCFGSSAMTFFGIQIFNDTSPWLSWKNGTLEETLKEHCRNSSGSVSRFMSCQVVVFCLSCHSPVISIMPCQPRPSNLSSLWFFLWCPGGARCTKCSTKKCNATCLVAQLSSLASYLVKSNDMNIINWLVVEPTHLKNMLVKLESFPQVGVKMKNMWNHQLVNHSEQSWFHITSWTETHTNGMHHWIFHPLQS